MEPVIIQHKRDHKFEAANKTQKHPRCGVCGRGKSNLNHVGTTASVNEFLSHDIFVYRGHKERWEARWLELLSESELEPCGRIVVEGTMCFPRRRVPDQGNHRFLLEKSLGDALQAGGYLEDDTWDRYEFGGLEFKYAKDEAWTRLMLFPMPEPLRVFDPPQVETLFA